MPRTLLIVRHGKSAWDKTGVPDHDRALTKRGKHDAKRMGQELQARGLVPDVVLTSTALRARDTAQRMARAGDFHAEVIEEAPLYGGEEEEVLGMLAALGPEVETAMIVGHNPLFEDLLALLTGERATLTTANVAVVTFPIDDWHQLVTERPRGRLTLLLQPQALAD